MRGLFLTGTDTGVGKTVVAAALMHRFRGGVALRYWKPIETGIEQDNDTATVRALGGCAESEVLAEGVRLPRPVSPHLAARLAGRTIDLDHVLRFLPADAQATGWIVEGAGGALVPVNESQLMTDLMARLALPVVVVARTSLGTINHALLTLEALRSRALRVAGVVLVGEANPQNREAIAHYGRVAVLGEMPRLTPLTAKAVGNWARAGLDPAEHLREFLNG